MRVLIVVKEPPLPPLNGLRLPLAAMLPFLEEDHDILVIALDGNVEATDQPAPRWLVRIPQGHSRIAALRRWSDFLARRRPLHADAYARALAPAIEDALGTFDPAVVHFFSSKLSALNSSAEGRPTILSALDAPHKNVEARAALARGPRRAALMAQVWTLRRSIADDYPAFDAVVMVTEEDAVAISDLAPDVRPRVIANGVISAASTSERTPVPDRITFHGNLGYAPNVDAACFAAHAVLPLVRTRRPDAELRLVGRSPAPNVLSLGELPGVVVTGEVPDVNPWLASTTVYLCPMRTGTGIKNKLLEGMAAGAPCVVTPLALQGIAARPGEHVLVGGDADALADQVVELLNDATLADRLGRAGRDFVLEHHTWAAAAAAYSSLYRSLAATPG